MANDEILVSEGEMSVVLRQMKKTFYSNKEIFLQELINNASNALDKVQLESQTNKNILDDRLIRLVPHKANKTLSIIDTGIGMTKTDLAYNLGVGFYSSYLVAHKVIVTSKHNDHDQYIWESQGASFIISKDINAQQPSRGTNITLFLKDNQYLEEITIKNLVIKNCQHISHRIYLWNENTNYDCQLINIWLHNQKRDDKFIAQKLMNNLPDDLVFSIISKLPLKSLKRFGCVRRSWTLLFENSHFMNLLCNNFICNHQLYYDDTYLLLNLSPLYQNHYKSSLFSISGEKFQNMEKLYWLSQIQEDYPEGFGVLGSSSINGILCLYVKDRRQLAYLWNPTTSEFKVIPPSPFENAPYYIYIDILYHGFGYDCVRDDYKVIREVSFFVNSDDDVEPHDAFPFTCIWEMYSLRRNSWTNLELHGRLPSSYDDNNKFYLEGMCHWLGHGDSFIQHLVSFDLINNVWIMTPPPSDIPMEVYDNFDMHFVRRHLFLLNESIALMSNYAETTTFYISILVEVGKKETWTKLFVFGPIPYIAFPIGTRDMGNILFQTHDGDLAWFDLNTHTVQKLGVNIHDGYSQLVVYKESLLTIEKINS